MPASAPIRISPVAKRAVDILASALGLLIFSPVLVAVAMAVRLKLGSPVCFSQLRPGYNGELFHILKFRTMTQERDAVGMLLPDAQRLGPFGKFLRSTSLDELPEFWNVLCGDMSLVGPRPLLPEYLPLYSALQRRRHEVKPGITGLAQISGRNALTWERKFELDVWYVDHQSFWLDIKILWLTFLKVIRREGVSQQGHATMPEFTGSTEEATKA